MTVLHPDSILCRAALCLQRSQCDAVGRRAHAAGTDRISASTAGTSVGSRRSWRIISRNIFAAESNHDRSEMFRMPGRENGRYLGRNSPCWRPRLMKLETEPELQRIIDACDCMPDLTWLTSLQHRTSSIRSDARGPHDPLRAGRPPAEDRERLRRD